MDLFWAVIMSIRQLSPAPDDQWAAALAQLDATRARAFAEADLRHLDEVYAAGSPAKLADAATISAYARRGGRVHGAQLRILSCRVVSVAERRVRLDVVEELGPSRVVWNDTTSSALPQDRPSRRVVTLVRTRVGWLIAGSRDVSPRRSARR